MSMAPKRIHMGPKIIEISAFIEELKKAGEVSYEEMIHIVSEKFSITTNMVVKLAREI